MSNHFVNETTDAAAGSNTTARLSVGDSFLGLLDGTQDNDWIRVELAAGVSYMITVAPRDPDGPQGAAADTVLEIFNAAGESIAMKDDLSIADQLRHPRADTLHPILTFEPDVAGVYYLSVSSYTRVAATDNSGGYSLELTTLEPPLDPNRDQKLDGTADADKLVGARGEDELNGLGGNDFLGGAGGNDELNGGAGDDTLEGGPGVDTLDGGANGNAGDTIAYTGSTEAVRVNLGKATATGGDAEGDVFENVENIIGSAGADWLRGDANDNRLTGLAGDDTLIGGGGGNDTLNGGAGDDTLYGGEGDDTLNGGAGADLLTGGPGGDTISYAGSDEAVDIRLGSGRASGGHAEGDEFAMVEHVTGSDHNDRLAGDNRPAGASTGGDNTLRGGGGNDEIYGGSGDDALNGDGGDDTLHGGAGDDALDGGAGDDTLTGGPGADEFIGGTGEDTVSYANALDEKVTVDLWWTASRDAADPNNPSHSDGDYFPAGHSVENVIGSPRGDTIHGDDGPNKLWGGAGADTLNARYGDDTIDGGPGGDTIDGGDDEYGGDDEDTVTYENSDAGVRVTVNATTGNEGGDAEGDRLSNVDNLVGSDHDDRLFGDSGDNKLSGGDGDDRIVANLGNDRVDGGADADTMDGDADLYVAAPVGLDTLSYAGSAGAVTIDLSRQYAVAASAEQQRTHYAAGSGGDADGDKFRGFENVTGGMGNDRLTGDGWHNTLIGGPGADRLDGGAPQATAAGADGRFGTDDDVMTGADTDTVSYAGSTAGVTITFSEVARRVNDEDVTTHDGAGSGGDAEGDRLLNIDKVVGTAHDDLFIASKLEQIFDGGANATMDDPMTTDDETTDSDTVSYANLDVALNIVAGSASYGSINIENLIIGGNGADTLTGDGNPNRLEGGFGADTLSGLGGADTLIGGPGNDIIAGGDGFDLLNGGPGADTLQGDTTGETKTTAYQNTNVQSFASVGGGRADVAGTSYGGDTVSYADSNRGVELTLGALDVDGADNVFGGANAADDFASAQATGQGGYAEGDTVVNVENIIGSDHADTLGGNNWFNVLTGGKGEDVLTGGGSPDIFVFAPGDSTGDAGDEITDFTLSGTERDAIDLRAFSFDLTRNADGSIATTLERLDAQGLKISDLIDMDGDGIEDDREITLPDSGKITLLNLGVGSGTLTIDNFVFVAGATSYRSMNIENFIGGSGDDSLQGDENPNRLEGGAGADALQGHAGNDTLIGGPGSDPLLRGGAGSDMIDGGPGADNIDGDAPGTQTRANVQSFENFHGGRVNVDNNLATIATSYGGDTVSYAGSNRGVELTLGALDVDGVDDAFGGANASDDFTSTSSTGKGGYARGDTVVNVENIIGSDHDDTLGGNNWYNVLTGGKGDDRLTGGPVGNDQSDIFVFAPGDSTGPAGDVITDFNVSGITLDDDSDGTPNADIYGNTIYYQRDAIDLRAFNFDLTRNADGTVATTLAQLESLGLKISNLMDADGDGTEDDREITLPDGGKITLIGDSSAIGALTIDNFVFDLI